MDKWNWPWNSNKLFTQKKIIIMRLKISTKTIMAIFCLLFFGQFINGQVLTKTFKEGVPTDFLPTNKIIEKVILLNPPGDFKILAKSTENDDRFASTLYTNIDFISNATISTENGFKIYSLKLSAKDALNISTEFDNFIIADNAILSLYTDNELTDSITSSQNNQANVWATRVYQGNCLNIVLRVPLNQKNVSSIRISKVNFGYKHFGVQFGNIGAASSCNINVACSAGNAWGEERNSVALIVANGQTACSAALLMNTCSTNTPYLLTANHCLQAGNINNWVFQFQFWSNTCVGNNGMNESVQFNGCQLRANSAASDFALLQLNQIPTSISGIRYSGWSRLTPANGSLITNTTILHHPKGDVMKVSVDNQAPTQQVINNAQCWILGIDIGATEGGSSGAPYFNQNHRIIGQHYGAQTNNTNDPCNQPTKFGGRFDISWTGGGTNSTRLSNWLDPTNSGALTTNTSNISTLQNATLNLAITGGVNLICSSSGSSTYTLTGVPTGLNVVWSISNTNIASLSSSGNQATITKIGDGFLILTATVGNSNCFNNNIVTRRIELGPQISTNIAGLNPPLGVSPGELLELSVLEGGSSYLWEVEGGTVSGLNNQQSVTIQVNQCPPNITNGYINVHVTITNACGTGNTYTEWTTVDCGTGGGQFRVSPNPSNGIMTVDGQLKNKNIKEIKITDKLGNIKRQIQFSGFEQRVTIDVSFLPTDIYYIQIFDGKIWEAKQVSIKR
jgi:lysyl endopeptidase